MSVKFKGIGEVLATFEMGTTMHFGSVVNVTKEGTVTNAPANSAFLGIVKNVADKYCTVQIGGYIESAYNGSKPAYGKVFLASNGGTAVKVHTEGRAAHVVSVDEDAGVVGFFFV